MHIGRRPIAAFGNSDGDLQMLQWTAISPGARFALLVRHTDSIREFAYDASSMGQAGSGSGGTRAEASAFNRNDIPESPLS